MAGETIIAVVGNLTADPELRSTKNGRSVAGFTIASTPRTFDRQSNQWVDGDALQVDEIGPSLRYATAQVAKAQRGTAGAYGNPASMPAGYTGGAAASGAPLPPSDPWGSVSGSSSSFGDFGKPESEPDF